MATVTYEPDALTLRTEVATTRFSVAHGHIYTNTQIAGSRYRSSDRLTKDEARGFADALRDLIRNDDLAVEAQRQRETDTRVVRGSRKLGNA